MSDVPAAVVGAVGALLGAAAGFFADASRQRRARKDSLTDALRAQRAEAYKQFMREAHLAAHLIGRTAPGCPEPLRSNPKVLARVDSEVARREFELSLFAEEGPLEAARHMRRALNGFRSAVEAGAEYRDETYLATYGVYREARSRFLAEARAEVLRAVD